MTKGINATLEALLDCVTEALADADVPVCVASTTIGEPLVASCCECHQVGGSGELWGAFVRLTRGDRNNYQDVTAVKACKPATWVAEFRLDLYRCSPMIDETGELPDPSQFAAAAAALHEDVATVTRAVNCCPLDPGALLVDVSVIVAPAGGCSRLTAVVRVPVNVRGTTPTE